MSCRATFMHRCPGSEVAPNMFGQPPGITQISCVPQDGSTLIRADVDVCVIGATAFPSTVNAAHGGRLMLLRVRVCTIARYAQVRISRFRLREREAERVAGHDGTSQ